METIARLDPILLAADRPNPGTGPRAEKAPGATLVMQAGLGPIAATFGALAGGGAGIAFHLPPHWCALAGMAAGLFLALNAAARDVRRRLGKGA